MDIQTPIKIFSGKIITESKMDKETKIQLLNYVQEADIYEVMTLLMDGTIEPVSEQSKPIIFERFKRSDVPEKLKDFMVSEGYLSEGIVSIIFLGPIKVARWIFEKCYRRCYKFKKSNQNRYLQCRFQCQSNAYQKRLKEVEKADCKDSKDPSKCEDYKKQEIERLKQKIQDKKDRVDELSDVVKVR